MRSLVAILAVLSLSACAMFTKARQQNVGIAGKSHTTAELIEALGNPQSKTVKGEYEIWHYDIYSADSARVYPYTAKVKNDQVIEFFADSSHETNEDRELRLERLPAGMHY